jgi:valyl-tRNA synthetase
LSFRVKSNEYFIPTGNINVEEEIAKLTAELVYTQGFLKSVQNKLSNESLLLARQRRCWQTKDKADALAKLKPSNTVFD